MWYNWLIIIVLAIIAVWVGLVVIGGTKSKRQYKPLEGFKPRKEDRNGTD